MAHSGQGSGNTSFKEKTLAEAPSSPLYGEDLYEHVTPGLVYIDTSCPGLGANEELFYSCPLGCDCRGICEESVCSCLERSKGAAQLNSAFECNSNCCCGASCFNRLTQRGPRRGLKIVSMGNKGLGVVTEKDIPMGAFVCEYAGEVIGENEALRRMRVRQSSAVDANYILVIREHVTASATQDVNVQTTVIDPTILGNIGRYLNHSCQPNLRLSPVRVESLVPIVALFAATQIHAGEELCYDYDSVSSSPVKDEQQVRTRPSSTKTCLCGSSSCRGFLPSDATLF